MVAVKLQLMITTALLAWCFLGCAHGPGPGGKRLYHGPIEPFDGLDTSALKGRRIVIDPGHGGVFRGARGVAGLDEADANLGVALHLARLLDNVGAIATLTRRTDCDFVEGDSLRLRDDLKARVAISNKIDPDLFISLHHNADLRFDPDFNEIQVYHRLDDDGPSLDAARAIAGRLIRNLGEDRCRVIGGNYHVLRNSVAPAVLCEPSFITNPAVESKLKSEDKQLLEATAYFLGLVDYFSRGVPQIASVSPLWTVVKGRPTMWIAFDGRSPIDAASVEATLDGVRLDTRRAGPDLFLAHPLAPLASGTHTLSARARNAGGNASRKASMEFNVLLEPAVITLSACPPPGEEANPRKITALVLDAYGNPAADSTRVVFTWKDGSEEGSACRATSSGVAPVYTGRDIPDVREIAAECEGLKASLDLARGPRPDDSGADTEAELKPAAEAQTGTRASNSAGWITGFVTDTLGRPLAAAMVTRCPGPARFTDPFAIGMSAVSDADGFFALAGGGPLAALEASKPGYRSALLDLSGVAGSGASAGGLTTLKLERFYSTLDPAAVVVIDAAGGAAANERTGPDGIEASSVNLAVAVRLQSLLESVGVPAVLTRETEENATGEDRVRRAEAAHPTLLVSISHAAAAGGAGGLGQISAQAVVSHYPGSSDGARSARLLSEELHACLGLEARVAETADYIIQQPSSPAVRVEFAATATAAGSASDAASVRLRAYALMCGILRYLGADDSTTFSIKASVTADGKPCPGALVAIDGALEVLSDARGRFQLRLLERRPHTAEVLGVPGRSPARMRNPAAPGTQVAFDQNTGVLVLDVTGR